MSSYVTIDFETAGPQRASACAVGLVRVEDGQVVDAWSTLINPEAEFSRWNVAVHGIRADDVRDAPTFPDVWPRILRTAWEADSLIAHNASFDMTVLTRSAHRYQLPLIDLPFACTLALGRRWWPRMPSYGLGYLAKRFELDARINGGSHHDALWDAKACHLLVEAGLETTGMVTVADAARVAGISFGKLTATADYWRVSLRSPRRSFTPAPNIDASPDGPLYAATVCFTGRLGVLSRNEAAQLVADAGGEFVNNMSARVDYLVVGEQDLERLAGHEQSSKMRKAVELVEQGHGIEIIDEAEFMQLLAG